MKKLISSIGLGVILAAAALSASASLITIDEGADVQDGVLTYDGAGGALIGTNINFSLATGVEAPVNQGAVLSCQGCLLNFSTGANILEGPSIWQWATGGSISLDGDLYDGANLITSGNLLSGVFDSINPLAIGGGSSLLFASIGTVAAAQPLIDYFGIASNSFSFANTELALQSCGFNGAAFGCGLDNADLAIASAVPVPATGLLFGIGAAGLVATRRKRS